MCGIAGIIAGQKNAPVERSLLQRMVERMAHRGPDGTGYWDTPGTGFGHLRLSIIDVAGSPQPMTDVTGRYTICYNGEVYNYRELRKELSDLGHQFRTEGDTEAILNAWAEWGEGSLHRLNGMFAFVIHDAKDSSVTLVRDRFGVKPLHYARLPDGTVIFASELKGLLAHGGLKPQVDPRAIDAYLAYGYVPDQLSMLAGVKKLPAGAFLRIIAGESLDQPRQWYHLSPGSVSGSSEDRAAELLDLIDRSVQARMVSDVPLGAFLSGGVDSSAVVASMAKASDRPVTSLSIGFDVKGYDESEYAARIATQFKTDHHTRIVSADDFSIIDRLADAFDEPFADASALATFRLCEMARQHVTVALSGDGADEAFAGYRRLVFFAHEAKARAAVPGWLRSSVFGTLGRIYPKADWAPRPLRAKSTLLALAQEDWHAYSDAVGVTGLTQRHGLYSDQLARDLGGYRAEELYRTAFAEAQSDNPLDKAQLADFALWLPGDILTKVDRTSMAVSLEAREPLLDYRLVEFALGLPVTDRVSGSTGKALMKKALESRLPEDILYRPKMGFVTPISAWFRGALAKESAGLGARLEATGWFDRKAIERVAEDHRKGISDNGRLLWQLLMLDKSLSRLGIQAG